MITNRLVRNWCTGRRFYGDSIGTDLSGGQWQRIALARWFLLEADLVLLDEPTSALDPEAEVEVLHLLKSELSDKTSVVITHRLPVLELADRVAVIDGGRVVAVGTHPELLGCNPQYAEMFSGQQSALNKLAGVHD